MVITFQPQILSIISSIKLISVNNAFVEGFLLNHAKINHVVQLWLFLEIKLIYCILRLLF